MASLQSCLWHLHKVTLHRFKLFLEPHALRDDHAVDPRLPSLPASSYGVIPLIHRSRVSIRTQPGKHAIDVIIDFLRCLWGYAKEQITREIGAVADLGELCVHLIIYPHTDSSVKTPPMYGSLFQRLGMRGAARSCVTPLLPQSLYAPRVRATPVGETVSGSLRSSES